MTKCKYLPYVHLKLEITDSHVKSCAKFAIIPKPGRTDSEVKGLHHGEIVLPPGELIIKLAEGWKASLLLSLIFLSFLSLSLSFSLWACDSILLSLSFSILPEIEVPDTWFLFWVRLSNPWARLDHPI